LARNPSGAVIADASVRNVNGGVVNDDRIRHRAVIDRHVCNVGDVIHRAVVVETITIPIAALVADANVTKPIVDAAVVADVASPIPIVITIAAAGIAPITGRP
jgi:hypothetical protein